MASMLRPPAWAVMNGMKPVRSNPLALGTRHCKRNVLSTPVSEAGFLSSKEAVGAEPTVGTGAVYHVANQSCIIAPNGERTRNGRSEAYRGREDSGRLNLATSCLHHNLWPALRG